MHLFDAYEAFSGFDADAPARYELFPACARRKLMPECADGLPYCQDEQEADTVVSAWLRQR